MSANVLFSLTKTNTLGGDKSCNHFHIVKGESNFTLGPVKTFIYVGLIVFIFLLNITGDVIITEGLSESCISSYKSVLVPDDKSRKTGNCYKCLGKENEGVEGFIGNKIVDKRAKELHSYFNYVIYCSNTKERL